MADNTSASGGYLLPAATPAPLEGEDLFVFIQTQVKGITGMDGKLVRPAPQGEPPNIPPQATAWAAIQITQIPADTFPAVIHRPDAFGGLGGDELQQNEQIAVLTSFYDTGVTGQAMNLATLLRTGYAIAQNREPLRKAGFAINSMGTETPVPVILKERWLYRVDLNFILSRQITRLYRVQNVLSVDQNLSTN